MPLLVFGTPILAGRSLPLLIVCLVCSVSVNLCLLGWLFLRQPNHHATGDMAAHQFALEPPHGALKGHLLHPHYVNCTTEQLVILLLLLGNAVQWHRARWYDCHVHCYLSALTQVLGGLPTERDGDVVWHR